MIIETNASNRKTLAQAISDEIGEPVKYLGMPSCAYQIGPYTVTRDAEISGEDFEPLRAFLERNGYMPEGSGSREETVDSEDQVLSRFAEALDQVPVIESVRESTENAGISETRVTIPLSGYTPLGLTNLLKTLYSHQSMIAVMTKSGLIRIDEELITRLNDEKPETVERISEILKDEIRAGMVTGVDFEDGRLTMAFPYDESNPTVWTAYSSLMLAIADRAKDMARAGNRRLDPEDGEMKYFCRNWLLQLGMGGPEHKEARRVLLDHLHGFAAFRTADKMDAHKARLAAKRKANREAAAQEVTTREQD